MIKRSDSEFMFKCRKYSVLSILLFLFMPINAFAVNELGIFELDGNPTDSTDSSHLDNGVDSEVILNDDPTDVFRFSVFGTDDIDISGPDQDTSIFITGESTKDDQPITTWGWKVGDPSTKVDIHNAWAGTTVYQGPTVPATGPAVTAGTPVVISGAGTFVANATGTITFTPLAGYSGTASVTYAVCDDPGPQNSSSLSRCDSAVLTVLVAGNPTGNVAPDVNPELIKTEVGVTTDINVLANDFDRDGDTLTLQGFNNTGTVGTVSIVGNLIRYIAPPGFGEDSFSYTVCDPSAACNTATVTVYIDIDDDNRISAVDDFVLTRPNTVKNTNALANDTDPEVNDGDDFDFGTSRSGLKPWAGEHRQGDAILYFGLDNRLGSGGIGTSAQSFWFLQDMVAAEPDFTFSGQHVKYDLLIQTAVGGGLETNADVFVWDPPNGEPSNPSLASVSEGNDCVGANAVICTTANRIDVVVPTDWPHHNPANLDPDVFQPAKYIEGGLNLSNIFRQFGAPVPCFTTMIAETRKSDSVTASLEDFLLDGFSSCSFRIEKTGDDVVVIGDIATYTISIENTGVLTLNLSNLSDPLIDDGTPGNETTLKAARAAGCDVLLPSTSCSFQVSYQTSASDPNPLPNTVTATMISDDGSPFTQSDDHIINLISAASVGDTVWLDEDGNGVFDAGEDGIANATVDLYADRNGDGTPDTTVSVAGNKLDLNGGGIGTDDDGYWYGIRVIDGLLDLNDDGVIDTTDGTDSGTVTVNGTTYTITNGAIQTGDGTIDGAWDQTQTDANGEYLFTQLPPNTYDVTITAPSGMDVTYDLDQGWAGTGTPDSTTRIILGVGESNTDADFGLNWVPVASTDGNTGTGAIGDRIWHDANNVGVQDEGEAGVAGVIVKLYEDDDGFGNFDGVYSTQVATTTTDANGNYIFDDLDPGAYVVEVDSNSLPGGLGPVPTGDPDGDGDNVSNPILLAPGDVYLNADWGYNSAGVPVSGTIYLDADVEGSLSLGDAGLYGITVNLVDASGNIVATATTGATGLYTFPSVIPGTYTVEVGDTSGALADSEQTGDPSSGQTGAVCTICDGSVEITVDATAVSGVDFGYVPLEHEAGDGLISGSVGLDALNPNNQVDPNEELADIDVTLFQLYDIIGGKVDFDGDGNVTNDPDDTGAIFVDDNNDGVLEIYCVYLGLLDVNCDHSGVNVTGGLLDANNDGVVNLDDDGSYTDAAGNNYIIRDGYIDFNGDGLITDADDGTVDGVEVNDGWFDVNMNFVDLAGTRELSPGDTGDSTELLGDNLTAQTGDALLAGYYVEEGFIYDSTTFALVTGQLAAEIDSTTTDASGFYAFGSLDPNGEYRVALDSTTYPAGTTNDFDYNDGAATPDGVSTDIDLGLVSGGTQNYVDFGLIGHVDVGGTNSLSGTIWNDVNADGTLLGEAGVFENVTVELYDSSGRLVATTSTNEFGTYTFGQLTDGDYTVKVTDENRVLTGYWLSDGLDGVDNNSQIDPYTVTLNFVTNQNDVTADFGYYIDPAIVGNTVFKDLNGNGFQDAGEVGFAGVEVKLTITYPDSTMVTVVTTTAADGSYSFGNLLLDEDFNGDGPGQQPTYEISVIDTQDAIIGYLTTEGQSAIDDATETGSNPAFDLDADVIAGTAAYPVQGGTDDTNDFGFALPSALYASASGLVWLDVDHDGVWDVGEPGIDEVTVFLYADRDGDGDVDSADTIVAVTNGVLDLDGGFWYGIPVIDGLLDTNGDGIITAADNGEVTVGGVTYTINSGSLELSGTPVTATLDGAWDVTQTDANGYYSYDDLPPGNYQVLVDPNELGSGGDLFGLDETAGNIGGTAGFNLTAGETENIKDLGYVPTGGTAVIEGNVFSDASADGILDPSEVGLGAVDLILYEDTDGDGIYETQVATTVSGPDGQYIFTGVPPGDYIVQVDLDDDDLQAFCGTSDPTLADCETNATTSDPITVDIDDTVSGVNFGFDNPDATYTITDTIFDDFNGDGTQGAGESGIAGVTVDLYDCGPDGICGNSDDVGVIATVITDENGDFNFDGVPEGNYELIISDNNGVLNDYYETTGTGGSAEVTLNDTTTGGDGVLDTVGDDGTATFGFRKPGTISGSVYSDSDNFGFRDDSESGFGGVLVQLFDDQGGLVAETLTAADGSYSFEYIDPGSYRVVVNGGNFAADEPLEGTTQTGDPDQVGTDCTTFCDNQTTTLLVLSAGESIQGIDFGYNDPALSDISGTVFNDFNENAVHEPDGGDGLPGTAEDNETGIEGVTVALQPVYDIIDGNVDLDGDPGTDDNGFISGSIDDVQVIAGLLDINGDGIVDGNDDGTFNGIAVVNGHLDVDGDGLVSGDENAGEDNGTVIGDPVATAVTDAEGNYVFKDVPDGDYIVAVTDEDEVVDGYTLTSGLDEQSVTADSTAGDVTDIDFGYVTDSGTGSIGDTLWLDSNGDGIQSANEPGIAGVTIYLCLEPITAGNCNSTNATATATTDGDGNFLFDDLPAGNYVLGVESSTVPVGLDLSASDFNYTTDLISLSEGENYLDADIGYKPAADTVVLGDRVWSDADGDGLQDPGEVGIAGVDVKVIDATTGITYTFTTDEYGNWLATGLPAGTRFVVSVDDATLPEDFGTEPTNLGSGADTYITPELSAGDVLTYLDFGFRGVATGAIGDTFWLDENGDGIRQDDETGLSNIGLRLISVGPDGIAGTADDFRAASTTTDANGEYLFTGLQDGKYYVEVAYGTGTFYPTPDSTGTGAGVNAANHVTGVITIEDGRYYYDGVLVVSDIYVDADFGYVARPGTAIIGDRIWSDANGDGVQDEGEAGIGGVIVYLCASTASPCDENAGNDLIATTVTDADGSYFFTGVAPGDYIVAVDSGTVSGVNTGDPDVVAPNGTAGTCTLCNNITSLTVVADTIYNDVDFGYYDPANASGSIGDFIYTDFNGDGDCDEVSGACTEPGIGGVTVNLWTVGIVNGGVDLNGDGVINNLDDGSYAGFTVINGLIDWNNDGTVDGDAGYVAGSDNGTVNGYTLIDGRLNIDGISGIDGDDDLPGQLVATMETADGSGTAPVGYYEFIGLPDGDYRVDVSDTGNVLNGLTVTQTAPQSLTIDCSTACNTIDNADFGYAPAITVGAIGDTVWLDDGDGIRQADEPGISGVTVNLYDPGPDGVIGGGDDVLLATTTTDANGNYVFDGLPADDYYIDLVESTLPDGGANYDPTIDTLTTTAGTNAADGQTGIITLSGGEYEDGADFGYVPASGTAVIGDRIWSDADGDGVQDEGEAGIGGVTVTLDPPAGVDLGAGDGEPITTITAADGSYEFSGLPAGEYTVSVDNGTVNGVNTGDPDVAAPNGTAGTCASCDSSSTLTIVAGVVYDDVDFGYYDNTNAASSIGDTVYEDSNGNGVQDPGETGIAGITVSLTAEILVVDGRIDLDRSGDGLTDSGIVDGVALINGQLDLDGDGAITELDDGYFNGYPVIDGFIDLNGNGVDDPAILATTGDAGDDGAIYPVVATTTTDLNGEYTFSGLPAGEYLVDVTDTANLLSGFYATQYDSMVSLGNNETYELADFGFAPGTDTGSIGDSIYFDADGDGVQDPGEAGISGVTLDLIGAGPDGLFGTGDDQLYSTTTDQNGNYLFDGLAGGQYQIVVTDLNNVVGELLPTEVADAPILISCATTCTDVSDADFGYKPTVGDVGNIGGTIWRDTVNPGVAELETEESGIPGIEVELWLDVNGDGIIEPGVDNLVRTTITDINGDYNFLGLPPGDYIVRVPDDDAPDVAGNCIECNGVDGPNGVLEGMQSIPHGSDPDADSNGHNNSYPVSLASGETDTSVDFAYVAETPYDISGQVYEDADGDGSAYMPGEDAVAAGAVVTLYRIVDGQEVLVDTTVTNSDGNYEFLDLPGGFEYVVKVDTSGTAVDGLEQSVDPDANLDSEHRFTLDSDTAGAGLDFAYWNGGVVTTPVTLSYFEAVSGDEPGEVHFSWATSSEAGNIGFDLYEVLPGGAWRRINEQIIPAQDGLPLELREYSYYARGIQGGLFYIVDIDIYTAELEHGPFELGEVYGVKEQHRRPIDLEAIKAEHEVKKAGRKEGRKIKMKDKLKKQKDKLKDKGRWSSDAGAAQPGWAARLAGGVLSLLVADAYAAEVPVTDNGLLRIEVRETGVQRLTYEDLAAADLDLLGVDASLIALTNHGEPVALNVVAPNKRAKSFGPGWFIDFLGEGLDTLYTDTNIYRLYLDDTLAARVSVDGTKPPKNGKPVAYYLATEWVEPELRWEFASPTGDPWFNSRLQAWAPNPYTANFGITVSGYAGPVAPVTLDVGMWGYSFFADIEDDHHVQISLNSEPVTDVVFDGLSAPEVSAVVPDGALQEGSNIVTFHLPMDNPGQRWDWVNLDSYAVTYPREFRAMAGQALHFTAAGGMFEVTGLESSELVVYRRGPDGMVAVLDKAEAVQKVDGSFTARFAGLASGAQYFVAAGEGRLQPELSPPTPDADITTQTAQYLVIAHPDFIGPDAQGVDALGDLALERQSNGLSTLIVDVEQVYAQFSHDIFDPQAIRDYIAYANQNMGTELVLLVGGDTLDPRGHFDWYVGGDGQPVYDAVSFVPSLYARTGSIVGVAPVDPLYADVDDDGVPDVGLGRFPVRTSEELRWLVDKTLAWEVRNYAYSSLFVADNYDTNNDYDFTADAEDMLTRLPGAWQADVTRAYMDDLGTAGARSTLIDTLNAGVALTSFVGHSDTNIWTFDGVFSSADAINLTNILRPTVLTQWGCWNTFYVSPQENTLGHEFLLNGEQGSAAVLGASTLTEAVHERELAKLLYDRLFQPGVTLGQAVQQAKAAYAATAPSHTDVILGWTLLGDPGLVVEEQ